MWTRCTFCIHDLGSNEAIESFPVGRRLAFDPARGRLWVVCRGCGGWNLTPLEERWEAIETAESRFRGARTRLSTGELGLARLSEGLDLVRIGRPLRPEFAAWRYGDQFGRRRRRALTWGTGLAVLGGGFYVGGLAMGGGLVLAPVLAHALWSARTVTRLRTRDGRLLKVRADQLEHAGLVAVPADDDVPPELGISVGYRGGREVFTGDDAFVATARIMRMVNRTGGRPETVRRAVERIQEEGHPERYLDAVVRSRAGVQEVAEFLMVDWKGREVDPEGWRLFGARKVVRGSVARLAAPERLALEMALHEERERRAMEGELRLLEYAWREAERVAEIADGLLVPEGFDEFVGRHRDGASDEPDRP